VTDRPLSSTAYVILGFLAREPKSGYEIKQAVDTSTRFFWTASYGQIYPELRRLEEAGLVESERDDAGGRKRTVHRITAEGRKALRAWVAQPAAPTEFRDEKLLKLFFTGAAGGARSNTTARETLEAHAAEHAELAERLESLRPTVAEMGDPHKLAVLRYGIELHRWGLRHCEQAARELARDERKGT
jgi:PadR family transcriptional regulator, regulatory protein AphA